MTHELNSRKHFEWDNHKKTFPENQCNSNHK